MSRWPHGAPRGRPAAGTSRGVPRGAPWWAWVLVALLAAGAAAALTAALLVHRDRDGAPAPLRALPAVAPALAQVPGGTAAAAAPAAGAPAADGCLGGPSDLDAAVVAAQRAPLTDAGAASFAATLLRWATATPAPPQQAATAAAVLTADATAAARNLSGTHDPERTTLTTSLADGRWYVESSRPGEAVVSVLARASGTREGEPQGEAWLAGSLVLSSADGVWRLRDITGARSVDDLLDVGTPYAGGC
ncbi:hypothetical protein NUM3379_14680 [Kineococcus sp. NUM-3379]